MARRAAAGRRHLRGRVGTHLEPVGHADVVALDGGGLEEGELDACGAQVLVVDRLVGGGIANVDDRDGVDRALVAIARERGRQVDFARKVARAPGNGVAAELLVERRRGRVEPDARDALHSRLIAGDRKSVV